MNLNDLIQPIRADESAPVSCLPDSVNDMLTLFTTGRFMAENSLWLHIAMTLACFSITPVIGPDGEVIIPPRQYTSSLACRPKPFPCKITSRNAAAVELIKHSIAALED